MAGRAVRPHPGNPAAARGDHAAGGDRRVFRRCHPVQGYPRRHPDLECRRRTPLWLPGGGSHRPPDHAFAAAGADRGGGADPGAAAQRPARRASGDGAGGQGRRPARRVRDRFSLEGPRRADHRDLEDPPRHHRAEAGRGGPAADRRRPGPLQQGPRAVRLRGLPRPPRAAADGHRVHEPLEGPLPGQARRQGRRVHRLRLRRRRADANPDRRPAGLCPRGTGRNDRAHGRRARSWTRCW